MPTGTSTIFGAFQAIDFSPRYNADGTPFFSVGTAKNLSQSAATSQRCEDREFDRDQLLADSDRLRCRHGSERIASQTMSRSTERLLGTLSKARIGERIKDIPVEDLDVVTITRGYDFLRH